MTMSCVDGPSYQCSGASIIRTDNGVALSRSGVQVYGKSTSDLAIPNPTVTTAFGLALASGAVSEVRLAKAGNGTVTDVAVLLSNLGISWSGAGDRPLIIETFKPTQGITRLDANGALTFGPLPPPSDLAYYDFAVKGTAATQANYGNNRYFPRTGNPSRCGGATPCPTIETNGLLYSAGNWRVGGNTPDRTSGNRMNGDGDIHAGNGLPDANGNPTLLPGATGPGVPFPGSKGYRDLVAWTLQYGNLGSWLSEDTVHIHEWGGIDEHTKNRRGIVAFGAVSDPALVPSSGTASYVGFVYGSHTPNGTQSPSTFRGTVVVAVDFLTRSVVVTIQNTVLESNGTPVPVALNAITAMGTAGSNEANYLTGPVNNGTLSGGLSGRFFGPIVAVGTGGVGPAEIGGAFSLSNSTTNSAVVGGFIARKQ